jgi:hypothetical protein
MRSLPFIPKKKRKMEVTEEKKLHFKIQPISALLDYTCECTIFSPYMMQLFMLSSSSFPLDVVRCTIDDVFLINFFFFFFFFKNEFQENCSRKGNGRD